MSGAVRTPRSAGSGSGISRTVSAIAYAPTVTPALPESGDAVYNVGALTGDITIDDPSGTPSDAQRIELRFEQDAVGGHAFTFGTGYVFGTDVQLAMFPTSASEKFSAAFEYDDASAKWRAIGVIRGF